MLLKFLAKTHHNYKGVDATGKHLDLKRDDVEEVADETAQILLMRYRHDFERVIGVVKPAHYPESDKRCRKGAKFKSK